MRVLCLVAAAPSGGGASFTRVGKSFDSSLQHVYQLSNDIHTAYDSSSASQLLLQVSGFANDLHAVWCSAFACFLPACCEHVV